MESESISVGRYTFRLYSLNTLIIGSGAASLNAAVSLHSMGQKDIILATSRWGAGTSNNAGSDKQTYYKLSLCGDESDSVRAMAQDLFRGRCMHGDIALCEAQGSVQAFMKLVDMGVPFPHDKYGSWAGYKTDNDPRSRATSAGPYTSKMMFTSLSEEVKRKKIRVLDNHQVIELLTDKNKTRVFGAIAIDLQIKDPLKAFVLFNAMNIILGTGGPGDIYAESVYPLSQTGSIGMAFRAGATGQNLTESQFGLASLKFRWNLSGSYQQVIPRYYSVDSKGKNEKEFLNDYFPDYTTLTKAIFLKGYQWPFDTSKIERFGSSLIDLLVFKERAEKGRRVFIDFRRNVLWKGKDNFLPDKLDHEVYSYLFNSGSLQSTPFERLRAMNYPAVELYSHNGIDLSSEPIETGICAQHNNGGLKGNIWWESDLRHLFPVGEVNGSHGVYRPGGSALNSGQVGSARAAEFISRRYNEPEQERDSFLTASRDIVSSVLELSDYWLSSGKQNLNYMALFEIRQRMSSAGSIIRDRKKISKAVADAFSLLKNIKEKTGASSVEELAECFRISDNCITHLLYLEAIRSYIDKKGRSRGSYIVTGNKETTLPDISVADLDIYLCRFNREVENKILELKFRKEKIIIDTCEVQEIPSQNLWFERVWKDYIEDNYIES
jgi:succinate dehydrogenase/fumarate reductase flavoprotein subunit